MSVEAMSWAFGQPLAPAPKLVLLAIANAANKSGVGFPGINQLVEACQPMQRRMVQRHIRQLEDDGLVHREERYLVYGKQTSNGYQLAMPGVDTTGWGRGVQSDTLGDEVMGVQSDTPHDAQKYTLGVSQLVHPEGVIAMTPSNSNLNQRVEPKSLTKTVGEVNDLARPVKSDLCWLRYREAYLAQWCVEPVRNQRTNTDLCRLVDRLGADIAPQVAGFYPTHKRPLYVQARHPTNLLLRDAEALRTDYLNGDHGEPARAAPRTMVELIGRQLAANGGGDHDEI